jgi:hypothetical protein
MTPRPIGALVAASRIGQRWRTSCMRLCCVCAPWSSRASSSFHLAARPGPARPAPGSRPARGGGGRARTGARNLCGAHKRTREHRISAQRRPPTTAADEKEAIEQSGAAQGRSTRILRTARLVRSFVSPPARPAACTFQPPACAGVRWAAFSCPASALCVRAYSRRRRLRPETRVRDSRQSVIVIIGGVARGPARRQRKFLRQPKAVILCAPFSRSAFARPRVGPPRGCCCCSCCCCCCCCRRQPLAKLSTTAK